MNQQSQSGSMNQRHGYALGMLLLAIGIFHHPLIGVFGSAVAVDQYSQALVVAPLSLFLLYMQRQKLLASVSYSAVGGMLYAVFLGAFVFVATHATAMERSNFISLSILLFGLCCIATFLCCYGSRAFRVGMFPLLFLLFMTPIPDAQREWIITFLQNGSAVATDWFFSAAGIPFRRDGVVLTLPSVSIKIAQECSGIRSSMVLLLACLVLGYLYLKSAWSRLLLFLLLIPLTIIKNGVRIFTLCTLGMYVDQSFLTGRLHHDGGFVFFGLAFAALWGEIWLLQKLEGKPALPAPAASAAPRGAS